MPREPTSPLTLRELLAYVCRTRPVAMCIDDAHWLDEESFELIRELFYVEGLDSRALAQVFEIEPSSVRARLHRVRASVARSLGG